jgi:hypothetical protein
VLSQAHSALSQSVSVLQVSVNAVSNAASNALSVANAASNAASVVSNAVSVVSNALSVETAARIAADNTISNAVSVVSNALSVTGASLSNLISAHNVLSNRVSANSGTGGAASVTSTELSAASAQAASAINVVSNALSALAVLHHALSDVVSNIISAGGGGVSVTSNELSVVSAQAKSALSDAISVGTATANDLSNAISALASVVSVHSATLSANTLKLTGQATSAGSRSRVVATSNVISSTTLVNVSGMSLSVSAGGVYQLMAGLMVNRPTAAAIVRFGLTFPAMARIRGLIDAPTSSLQGGIPTISAVPLRIPFNGDSASGSVIVSSISLARVSLYVMYDAVLKASANGVIQLQAAGSSGAAAITILDGSFIRLYRLN